MADEYRKIELQSSADFFYLQNNCTASSRQKLDLHFPTSASPDTQSGQPDAMRDKVKELVDEFILQTFEAAKASISVNGLDASEALPGALAGEQRQSQTEQVEFEPFDSRLASKVSSLYAQLETLTTNVAQLRREAPSKAAMLYAEALTKAMEEDDTLMHDANDDSLTGLELALPDSWSEVQDTYMTGLQMLIALQGKTLAETQTRQPKGLTETLGKIERANKAVDVVEKMG